MASFEELSVHGNYGHSSLLRLTIHHRLKCRRCAATPTPAGLGLNISRESLLRCATMSIRQPLICQHQHRDKSRALIHQVSPVQRPTHSFGRKNSNALYHNIKENSNVMHWTNHKQVPDFRLHDAQLPTCLSSRIPFLVPSLIRGKKYHFPCISVEHPIPSTYSS